MESKSGIMVPGDGYTAKLLENWQQLQTNLQTQANVKPQPYQL